MRPLTALILAAAIALPSAAVAAAQGGFQGPDLGSRDAPCTDVRPACPAPGFACSGAGVRHHDGWTGPRHPGAHAARDGRAAHRHGHSRDWRPCRDGFRR